jgi:nondiscriminating aspartyl-tRNA synthetase
MSTEADIVAAIALKGEQIKVIKAEKLPTLKEDLAPFVAELLALKLLFKEITGKDFDPPKVEKVKGPAEPETVREGPSKSELSKLAKKANKEAAKAKDREEKEQAGILPVAAVSKEQTATEEDLALAHLYGDSPLIRSAVMTDKNYREIPELDAWKGQKIWLRSRVANSRAVGKGIFLVLRSEIDTIQAVVWESKGTVPKAMVKYVQGISLESIVDIECTVKVAGETVQSCTVKHLELQVSQIHVVSKAQELPFMIDDAGRSEEECARTGLPTVAQDTALNYRWIDLRTPANQAIFRIQSGVGTLFREYLLKERFVEIHSPKLGAGTAEGGANVFTLKYFDRPACLAQSPQLYKQMAAACAGLERVMEIGPVFRAENSNTHRHLCEFVGMDFEMTIKEHYYEVLDVMGNLFHYIFDGINERFKRELEIISQQYPFEPLKYCRPPLRITFQEGITLLHEGGFTDARFDEDISTPHEKALGKIISQKYGTDFYMMDKYPLSARPFYTMPCPENPELSNSYDLFIRGEEIVSGAQRIHDPVLLTERATAMGIPLPSIASYIDAFKHGALPHGGGGIGLERVVMLFLGLKNIRKASMFPRDPSRLTP